MNKILLRLLALSLIPLPLALGYFMPSEETANVGWWFLLMLTLIGFVVAALFTITSKLADADEDGTPETESLVRALQFYQDWVSRKTVTKAYIVSSSLLIIALAFLNEFYLLAMLYAAAEMCVLFASLTLVATAEPHAEHWKVVDGLLQSKHRGKNDDLNNLMRQATKKPATESGEIGGVRVEVRGKVSGGGTAGGSGVQAGSGGGAPSRRGGMSLTNPLHPLNPLNPINQHSVSDHNDCTSRNHRYDPTPTYSACDSSSSHSSSSSSCSSSSSSCSSSSSSD